jgi:hypothetical protein
VFFQLEITQVWSLARKGHKFTGTARLINTRGWKIEPMLDRVPLIQASMKQSIEKGPFAQREESANYHDDAFFSCVDLWIVIQAWASMSDAKTKAKQDSKGFSYGKWSCTCKRWLRNMPDHRGPEFDKMMPACLPTQPFKFGMKWT